LSGFVEAEMGEAVAVVGLAVAVPGGEDNWFNSEELAVLLVSEALAASDALTASDDLLFERELTVLRGLFLAWAGDALPKSIAPVKTRAGAHKKTVATEGRELFGRVSGSVATGEIGTGAALTLVALKRENF